jgi:hypothetical protein
MKKGRRNPHRVVWCEHGYFPFYYGFCPSKAAWDRELKRLKTTEYKPYPTADGRCNIFKSPKGDLVILVTIGDHIDKTNDPNGIIGMLVHEGAHVWQNLRDLIGEDHPSAEFEAYTLQTIVQELITAYSATRRFK